MLLNVEKGNAVSIQYEHIHVSGIDVLEVGTFFVNKLFTSLAWNA